MDQTLGANITKVCALSRQGDYDYIIVGSGMGGGVVARTLVEAKKRVLLIERGGLLFTTHCLNTSRPHWNHNITEGPSQDNDIVFNRVKQPVHTTSDSYPYVGGPVHCLGGRSNVWGLYAPPINKEVLEWYFPASIKDYLTKEKDGSGYDKAYRLMCNDPNATLGNPYPLNVADSKLKDIINQTCNELKCGTRVNFTCAPVGAQFTPNGDPKAPNDGLYRIPQGAFSTVDWLLDRLHKKDGLLTVLLNTEVMAVTGLSTAKGKSVSSLTVRQNSSEQLVEISTFNTIATVLCAGSIDTAVIALRSGLQGGRTDSDKSVVGKGLNDHSIWGSRFKVLVDSGRPHPPLKLQGWWTKEVLINVVVNANTYLGSSEHNWFPCCHYDSSGAPLSKVEFEDRARSSSRSSSGNTNIGQNTVQVTFEFTAPLEDANVVLNAPESVPVIRISSEQDKTSTRDEMESKVHEVQKALINLFRTHGDELEIKRSTAGDKSWEVRQKPQVTKGGFGVVAHEVGTMRMIKDDKYRYRQSRYVVDDNLMVHGWNDLYVCDMSVFPVSPAANPSLTLVALAQRLGAHLASKGETIGTCEPCRAPVPASLGSGVETGGTSIYPSANVDVTPDTGSTVDV